MEIDDDDDSDGDNDNNDEPYIDIKKLGPIWVKKISKKLNLITDNVKEAVDKYWDVEIDSDGDIIVSDNDELDINNYCFRAPENS